MMEKENVSLDNIKSSTFTKLWQEGFPETIPELYGHIGSGSGGYADHIFKYAALELFGITVNKIDYKQLRCV